MDFLFSGEEEKNYQLRWNLKSAKFLAKARRCSSWKPPSRQRRAVRKSWPSLSLRHEHGRRRFSLARTSAPRLKHAVQLALTRAGLAPNNRLLVWARRETGRMKKFFKSARKFSANACATAAGHHDVQHGYIESASILVSLAAALTRWPAARNLAAAATAVRMDQRPLTTPAEFIWRWQARMSLPIWR